LGKTRALRALATVVKGNVAVGARSVLPTGKKLEVYVPDLPIRPPMPRPTTQNKKLENYVEQVWRHAGVPGTVGDGTAFDAIRNEIRTGRLTADKKHIKKGECLTNGLNNLLKRRDLAPADRALAEDLLFRLRIARKGLYP